MMWIECIKCFFFTFNETVTLPFDVLSPSPHPNKAFVYYRDSHPLIAKAEGQMEHFVENIVYTFKDNMTWICILLNAYTKHNHFFAEGNHFMKLKILKEYGTKVYEWKRLFI